MDFFQRQDKARRNTKVLVFYFAVAVVLLVVATYAAAFLIFGGSRFKDSIASAEELSVSLWQPDIFLWTTLGTLLVIFMGSVSKTLQLNRGGSAVAEMLDGRLIDSNSVDPDERKLLNVVEEMAIASGVPVPQVYVMDKEAGINAFSAGFSASDAAIGVTHGCMKRLSRDELQGVVGHEFSHILNGDMRLNLRLMGLIFGILCLTVIGRVLLRTRGRKNPLPLLGLALVIIGWAGVLFGRLIQAAVSRQREFLADASAVQFTRNPGGLADALKKIGGLASGSRLTSAHAEEASHLFFANGMRKSLFGIMATHPPLPERIRALDPSFDGNFPVVAMEEGEVDEAAPQPKPPPLSRPPIPVAGFPSPQAGGAGFALPLIAAQSVVPNIGQPAIQHLHYAVDLRKAIPPGLESAAHEPLGARALVCALLLSDDPPARQKQLDELGGALFDLLSQESSRIWPETEKIPAPAKIPLLDLALPALRRLSPEQFQQFRAALQTLVESDRQISLFEYMLQKMVIRHLEPYFLPAPKRVTQFYALRPLARECGILLSAMAYAGQDPAEVHGAFARGAKLISHAAQTEIPFVSQEQCDLQQIDAALERLSQAAPQIKKNLLNACAETIAADGMIHEREAELMRAIADALDCPLPPFVETEQKPML